MAFCLTKSQENKLKEAIVSGQLDPFVLSEMSSQERRMLLEKFVDTENASNVNSLFESKLLLKNQITGFKTWAKQITGINEKVRRDLFIKIDKLSEAGILNADELQNFKEDLVRTRLGVSLTFEEAKTVNDLSKNVSNLKEKTDVTKSDIQLGRAKLELAEYVNSLKPKNSKLLVNVAGLPRSLMASLDLSAPLNQGWGMVSRKRFYTSLGGMVKSVMSENNFKNLQAYIITHPEYQLAKKSGLRITELGDNLNAREEQFMSNLIDRIPGFAASQRAYVGFLNKMRMDQFSDLIKKAEIAGENVSFGSPAAKDIANVVNTFTGGASVGRVEGAVPLLNAIFFSPRKIKSTINMFNPLTYINPKTSKTARIEATRNLIGSLAMSASIITLYSLMTGKEPEKDPKSTDFGKIRSGDTRLDVTGGNATYAILLARIISGRKKTSSGVSQALGTGYGETSVFDLIAQFIRYKLSPNASFLVDAVTGANAIGEKKTVPESVLDRFKPLFLNSVYELLKSDTEGKFGFTLAGLLGAGLSTYSSDSDWTTKTTKEMIDFREQVGEQKFGEANDKYNKKYDEWFEKTRNTDLYKALTDEEKTDLITKSKEDIKSKILKEFGYKKQTKKFKSADEIRKKNKVEKLRPISSLIEGVNQMLSNIDIVPEALAADGDKIMSRINVNGDNVEIEYVDKKGNWVATESKNIDNDINFIQQTLGRVVDTMAEAVGIHDLGTPTKKERLQHYIDLAAQINGNNVAPTPTPTPTPKPKYKRLQVDSGNNGGTVTKVDVPEDVSDTVSEVFGDIAQEAADVLHHPYGQQKKGRGNGENASFKINNIDVSNEGYDKALNTKEYVGDTKGKDGKYHSIDRGLFRINSRTFQTFLFGKEERQAMYDAGVIDDPLEDGNISKADVKKYWDGMNELDKNVKMAKIIYEKQGWDAWYGAPARLVKSVIE